MLFKNDLMALQEMFPYIFLGLAIILIFIIILIFLNKKEEK